jgi:mono/diheme cytochrome c family protein
MRFKSKHTDRPLYPITADTSPEGLARGKYLIETAMACTEACHTPESGAPLSGMVEEINEGPLWARFAPPNLTPDKETGLGDWTDAEIARAIREGVDKDGVELVLMPSYNYHALSDTDVAAIVGYLRSLEPVKNPIPSFDTNIAGKMMVALGMFGPRPLQDPITEAQVTPEKGSVAYGEYMVHLGACSDCHGVNLAGGPMPMSEPGAPPAANLTPGGELVGWTIDDFIKAVHTGVKPSGDMLSEEMPRFQTSDEDLAAIFAYLQTLPAAKMAQ